MDLVGSYIPRLRHRCAELNLPMIEPDQAETLALSAIQILANREQYTDRKSQFQKSFTVPVTSGLASLAAQTDLLIDHIQNIVHSDDTLVSLLPTGASETDLTFARNTFFYRAVRRARRLTIKQGDGSNVPDGTITFDGGYAPALADLPPQFEDNILEISIGLIAGTESKDEQTGAA